MFKKLSALKKEDICPNCGTACFATDVLCPKCGENLDELFEQLPDLVESYNIFRVVYKYLSFLTWLTPLLIILSPLIVSLVTALPFALKVRIAQGESPFQLIWYAVSSSALVITPDFLIICAIPLFLCANPHVRARLGRRLLVTLATLFSILSAIGFWSGLQTANIVSASSSFAFFGMGVLILTPASWVYFVSVGGIILIVLNLMTVIGQEKTA
jgi:hypothetical protein